MFAIGVVIALLAVGCASGEDDAASPSSTSQPTTVTTTTTTTTTTEPPTTTLPALSDAATIWCDEERWQVIARASQLGLDTPATNPSTTELDALMNREVDSIPVAMGKIETMEAELAILDKYIAIREKYDTGEWNPTGVLDSNWTAWRTTEAAAYARSCAAAYELASGRGASISTPSANQWTDDGTDGSTATTEPSESETSTTTPSSPGRLVPEGVVACPDFIEATFRNTGGEPVTIVETILFISGGDEPFGYGTDWTPTVEPGATVTWRTTPADLGLDWIGPGTVSVGARPETSAFEYVYAEGPNPHGSCTAVAPPATTTAPPISILDVTGSSATCSTGGIDMTFTIRNTGGTAVELYQVALFPGGPLGHAFFGPENWWPLPTVSAGETVSHRETFSGLDIFKTGDELEIHVDSSDGRTSTYITCS